MNIDIRLALGFFDHPKTRKLARRLGWEAVIGLLRLWMWAAENRPRGELTGLDAEDVELAASWEGEQGAFTAALVTLRWLDESGEGYVLHGWEERQAYASRSEERSDRARLARLSQINGAAYRECLRRGLTGLSVEEYEAMKNMVPLSAGQGAGKVPAAACVRPAPETGNRKPEEKPLSAEADAPAGGAASGRSRARFVPPSVQEVQAYCDERGNGISGQAFCDWYESNGWKVGRSGMRDWKAAVRTWERKRRREPSRPAGPAAADDMFDRVRNDPAMRGLL